MIFFVNFRIVKKHWGFIGKSRATRKDEKSRFEEVPKWRSLLRENVHRSRIIYYKFE